MSTSKSWKKRKVSIEEREKKEEKVRGGDKCIIYTKFQYAERAVVCTFLTFVLRFR
jgi:hypothetical protein